MTTKIFDAVEMKRQGSLAIYQITSSLSTEQQLAFWQQRTEMLIKQQRAMITAQKDSQQSVEHTSATTGRR